MLQGLARFVVRRRVAVLLLALVAIAGAGAYGGGVATKLSSGGFDDPASQSVAARALLTERFGAGEPNVVLLVTAKRGAVDGTAATMAGSALTEALRKEPGVATAVSYWSLGRPAPLRSNDGRQALVLARIAGTDDVVAAAMKRLSPRYTRSDSEVDVRVGGQAEVFRQVSSTVENDLKRAEGFAIPITMVLLVIVFGSFVAASLPLAIGAIAVLGTLAVLRVLLSVTDVSIFSLNLTTALGMGLAIDYSLFVVSRYREELRAGRTVEAAVIESVRTAGRTVLFSALTVAASLAALLVFPLYFLRSFAYAGIAVVALATFGAVVVLPALLAVLGPRVDSGRLWRPRKAQVDLPNGFWHRVATAVMRRPVGIATGIIALLLLLGAPFLGVRFGLPDDRVLPSKTSSHQVQQEIRHGFTSHEADALNVVSASADASSTSDVTAYAERLSLLPDVSRVDALTGSYAGGNQVAPPSPASAGFSAKGQRGTWLSVIPKVEPMSPAGERLAKAVRTAPSPWQDVVVGGPSASLVDSKAAIFGQLPLAAAIIVLVTFVVLFMMTGSVLVPAKALVLNVLSLTATFGAMVWIFQEGHLAGVLDFTAVGSIDTSIPILMFCIAFGLSMDYEVFLLSRIKEEYDRTGDNTASVALGLERTGRIVTAAAALLAVVFASFATSGITFIKMMGVGLTLAVLMDATLVRGALVPAFMRLAGNGNWWAPAPLRRFHNRFGFREATQGVPALADDAALRQGAFDR
ncbi:MAG: MMPL family transporter [Actinomycetota bacterium]